MALAGSVRFGPFPNGVGLGWAVGLGFFLVEFRSPLTRGFITELIWWFKTWAFFRRYRNAVVMLGRMIALHHRMTQNAADMMQLIQETLNQADEAHSRRIHGGHDGVRHHHVRGLSLAESSRPRAHDRARLDEVEPPGPGFGIRSTRGIWLTLRR